MSVEKGMILLREGGAHLAAALAHVRLLASMNSSMHRQGGSLNELFPASRVFACVRPDATVYALCEATLSVVRVMGMADRLGELSLP